MSWLGGLNDSFNQLSSITGQIGGQLSNFTKEVLTETAEENIDYAVEVKKLGEDLKQYEALANNLKQENEALKEKIHSAELHISTSGIEFEAKLREKAEEIAQLRQKLSRYGENLVGEVADPVLSYSFSNVSLHDDGEDFHDTINYQREINRLSRELAESQSKAEAWKQKAKAAQSVMASTDSEGHSADVPLKAKIRELENTLRREADHHQQEMRSMQDAHSASTSRHQEEIRNLKLVKSDSSVGGSDAKSNGTILQQHRQDKEKLETELGLLQEQTRTRNRQLQVQKRQIEELHAELKDREKELKDVKESKSAVVDEAAELRSVMADLKDKNEAAEKKWKDLAQELSQLLSADDIPVNFNEENVQKSLLDFVRHFHHTAEQRVAVVAENERFRAELEALQNKTVSLGGEELAESDQWHQEGTSQAAEEDQNIESDQHHRMLFPALLDIGHPQNCSSPHVPSARKRLQPSSPQNPGDLTLTLEALRKQVDDYELEIEEYERVQSEWQAEKKSLHDLLNRYQAEVGQMDGQEPVDVSARPTDDRAVTIERLKRELDDVKEARGALEKETSRLLLEKEQLHVASKNLEEELNSSIVATQQEKDALQNQLENFEHEREQLQAAYDVLMQELNKSREDRQDLDQALDALDTQHQDEMAQLLSVRDELKEEVKSTKNLLELETESKNDLLKKLQDMKVAMQRQSQDLDCASSDRIRSVLEEKEIVESKLEDLEKIFENLKFKDEENLKLIANLTSEKEIKDEKIAQLLDRMTKEDEDFQKLRTRLDESEGINSRLQKDLEDSSRKHLEEAKRKEEIQIILNDKDSQIARLESDILLKEEDSLQKSSASQHTDEFLEKINTLEDSLVEKDVLVEKLANEKRNVEEKFSSEVLRLQEEIEGLGSELENAGKEMAKTQSAHEEALKKMVREKQDAVAKVEKDSEEKSQILKANREASQNEADATNKVYLEKIAHLEKLNLDFRQKMEDVQTEDDERISKLSEESETLVKNLRQQYSNLTEQYSALLEQHAVLKASAQHDKDLVENRLKAELEQKVQSQKECAELKNLLKKAEESVALSSSKITSLKQELEEAEQKVSDTSQKIAESGNSSLGNQVEHEAEVSSLMAEIEQLKKQVLTSTSSLRATVNVEEMLNDLKQHDLVGLEKSDLSKDDIGSLLQLIKERDNVIEILRQKQSSDSQNFSAAAAAEVTRLEDAHRSLVAEKEQILSVISEKTRENRKLKDEAHKMMDMMAESRAALEKVQQENAALLAKYEGYDREMTKEAVGKLSRLVREKELEIESLQQKCGTLLEVLQQQQPAGGAASAEGMVSGQQVQALLKDKETLTSQVQQLLNERNHLVALLNQRQIEVEQARGEISKAVEALERDADDNSKLQIDYGNLVHDYEQTQLKLATVQKELGSLREKSAKLEKLKTLFLPKLESSDGRQSRVVVETLDASSENSHSSAMANNYASSTEAQNLAEKLSRVSETLSQKETLLRQLNEENSRKALENKKLQNDSKEKDILIHSRTDEMKRAKRDLAAKTNEVEILRKSVENLREQVAGLSKNCEEARVEVRDYRSRLHEKEAESRAFQETNAQLSMLLKEKEYELENVAEKCQRLAEMAKQNQDGKDSESQKLLAELDNSKQALLAARHERDQVMLSLKQRKMEGDKYSEEAKTLREKEMKLESELARLRNHLIQVEEAYTQEAVLAEDREASLKEQLEQTRSTHNTAREATELSQQRAESLREQLRTALAQRDQAIQQLQLAQEQGMQYATALQKLQVAVERMQREEAANFAEQLEKVKVELELRTSDANAFEVMTNDLKTKLENANEALKSASRLSNQLELKEENIDQLKNIVAEKQLQIDALTDKLHLVTTKNEGMVDKEILKNLVIGYFTSPNNKRPDVLRLITAVLDFSPDETQRVTSGWSQGGARAWIGGWLWRGGDAGNPQRPSASVPTSPRGQKSNESFAQSFVKFLESESMRHQAAKLPMAAMINEAQQKRRPPLSPGLASVPTPVGFTAAERAAPTVAGRYSPYLLSSNGTSTPKSHLSTPMTASHPISLHPVTPVLPTFSPIINPKPAAEQEILKDILSSGGDR